MKDSLGNRIKEYERASEIFLTPRSSIIVRVDGRAFHTFTRGCEKPYDKHLIKSMAEAAKATASEMMGFKLGYIQSDEATFLLTSFDKNETQGWFGHSLNKIVSISASLFTANFNREYGSTNAVFDARAFVVPYDDAPNVFIWRQQDWERNSIQMYGQSFFSHKELQNKNLSDIHEMLHGIGENWASLPSYLKNGTFIYRSGAVSTNKENYQSIKDYLDKVVNV